MANVQVFAYKSVIGINAIEIDSNEENGYNVSDAIINDITQPGQLGCVADASKCDFSQEAIDLLKKVKPSRDAIGDVDIYKDSTGSVIFAWLGTPMHMIDTSDDVSGSRDYDISALDNVVVVPNNPPENFIVAVDELLSVEEA